MYEASYFKKYHTYYYHSSSDSDSYNTYDYKSKTVYLSSFGNSPHQTINILYEFYQGGISLKKLIERVKTDLPSMERRHINYYRKRIVQNRQLIQYGLNLISPESIFAGEIQENQKWVKTLTYIRFVRHT